MPVAAGAGRETLVDVSGVRLALFSDTFAPQVNGVSRTLERLVQELRSRGAAVQVFTTDDPDASAQTNVTRYPSRPFWAYPHLRLAWPRQDDVLERLRAFQPTLVHVATEFGVGLAGRRAARVLGVPLVTSYHTNFAAYASFYGLGLLSRPGWAYLRWFHGAGRRMYCPTRAVVRELEHRGFPRCRVWSRGVATDRFSPAQRSAALRAQLGADDGTIVVAYVGRIAPEKNVEVALTATGYAMAARPGRFRLLVVGEGPWEDEARRRAPADTRFTGRLQGPALAEAYASSDVLLFPSATDTFGNVMLEAMASGTLVIGADVGPTREVLLPGRGWVCPPGDAHAMAQTLVHLADNRDLLDEVRRTALAHARHCTWSAVWDALFADYLTVQAGSTVTAPVAPLVALR